MTRAEYGLLREHRDWIDNLRKRYWTDAVGWAPPRISIKKCEYRMAGDVVAMKHANGCDRRSCLATP